MRAAIHQLRHAYIWYGGVVLCWLLVVLLSAVHAPAVLSFVLVGLEFAALGGMLVTGWRAVGGKQ